MKLISRWTGGVSRSIAAEVAQMCRDKWCLRQESKSRIKNLCNDRAMQTSEEVV